MNKLVLVLTGIAISLCFAVINYATSGELRAVKSGKAKLVCDMKDGVRVIDRELVVNLVDGVWVFSDEGHARNCKVIKGGDL